MRQMKLSILVLCVCLWVSPEAFADDHIIWHPDSLEDGGSLKEQMVSKGHADEEGFSCMNLLGAAWGEANQRGIADEVDNPTAHNLFVLELGIWFFQTNNLPCETMNTRLTWLMFGEIGRLNGGYTMFTAEAIAQAKAKAEAAVQEATESPAEAAQTEAANSETTPVHLPPPPSYPPGSAAAATPTTQARSCRRIPFVGLRGEAALDHNGKKRSISTCRSPLPTQEELEADAIASEGDDLEAQEKAEQEARERAERVAERERLEHEIEVQELRQELQEAQERGSRSDRRQEPELRWYDIPIASTGRYAPRSSEGEEVRRRMEFGQPMNAGGGSIDLSQYFETDPNSMSRSQLVDRLEHALGLVGIQRDAYLNTLDVWEVQKELLINEIVRLYVMYELQSSSS